MAAGTYDLRVEDDEIIGDAAGSPRESVESSVAGSDAPRAPEFGGRDGPEPTRYGDWEKNGRCIDF